VVNADNLLIFLHIPKTAGSTLNHILARQYPAQATYSIDGDKVQTSYDELRSLPEEQKRQLACVKGHMPFGIHSNFSQQSTYITFLRDPANWVRSYYLFILNIPTHPFYRDVAACQGIEAFCELLTAWGMNDFQTRILVGTNRPDDIMPPYDPLPENPLATAIQHIEAHIPVVGLSEQFDESLMLMKKRFRWRNVHYLRQNVTSRNPAFRLSEQQKGLIYRNNPLDCSLYAYARNRLQGQIESDGAQFHGQLRRFRRTNRLFASAYPWYMLLKINRLKSGFCRLIDKGKGP
jgi:hypothetical protein